MSRIQNRRHKVRKLRERDGDFCRICGRRLNFEITEPKNWALPTIDHIKPRSKGGQNDLGNLRLVHAKCNGVRGNLPAEYFTTHRPARPEPPLAKSPAGPGVVSGDRWVDRE